MDRFVNQDDMNFQPGKVTLDIQFAAGASGAVPSALSGYILSAGITGMALAATGKYTVNLQDSYIKCTRATFNVVQATYDASHGQTGYPIVLTPSSGTAPLVTFQCTRPDTGAAVAVTEGDIVQITLEFTRIAEQG